MGFNQQEVDRLLAATGRRCCICGSLHNVQLHHIVPKEKGGTDEIDNAIPLCPNCHDEVHGSQAIGRTTRSYSTNELKIHRERAIEYFRSRGKWAPLPSLEQDKELILFFAQALDRPAFRTRFHEETSFSAFDKGMEDTLIAFNTGCLRTRNGTLIEHQRGKVYMIYRPWREEVERIVSILEDIRMRLHIEGIRFSLENQSPAEVTMRECSPRFRSLCRWVDSRRREIIRIMNSMLQEIEYPPLKGIR